MIRAFITAFLRGLTMPKLPTDPAPVRVCGSVPACSIPPELGHRAFAFRGCVCVRQAPDYYGPLYPHLALWLDAVDRGEIVEYVDGQMD